jgi:hypothetical protein
MIFLKKREKRSSDNVMKYDMREETSPFFSYSLFKLEQLKLLAIRDKKD